MRSIIGQCPDCCECPAPVVLCATSSASLSKVGFPEYTGYASTPPRFYLSETWSGGTDDTSVVYSVDYNGCNVLRVVTVQSGSYTYDYSGNIISQPSCFNTFTRYLVYSGGTISYPDETVTSDGLCAGGAACDTPTESGSATSHASSCPSTSVPNTCGFGPNVQHSGGLSAVLSNEYTTAILKANTIAALPSLSVLGVCGAIAAASLSTDESSYSAQKGTYRLVFTVPKVGSGKCYKITWNETFTPSTGSPVLTPRSFTWDGVIPTNYDPTDQTTWPSSDARAVDVPASNGAVAITDVVATCTGCTS